MDGLGKAWTDCKHGQTANMHMNLFETAYMYSLFIFFQNDSGSACYSATTVKTVVKNITGV
jgi:hypothetical protein